MLQEVSINAEIYFIAKGYTPKLGKFPVIPKDDREVRSLIQQKFSGEDRVFEVEGRKIRQPSPTIMKYIDLVKRVFEQNSISHERYAKCLFDCAIVTGVAAVSMERLKILGVKAFTPMDEKGYYPVGNLRATIMDWRIAIAEMEREYVIRLYVAVDKSIIMAKMRKFKIEIDDQQRVNIKDYCEKARTIGIRCCWIRD